MKNAPESDQIDGIYQRWAEELPGVATHGAQVLARARRITLRARPQIEAVFKEYELDTGEFDVLATLRRSEAPLRPTELFRALMISSGGLTDRLDRLESRGLIRRRPSEEDARSMLVELTAQGRKRIEAAFRDDMEIENALVASLTREERDTLVRLLRKLLLDLESRPK